MALLAAAVVKATPKIHPHHSPSRVHTTFQIRIKLMSSYMHTRLSEHTIDLFRFQFFVHPEREAFSALKCALALGEKESSHP